MANYSYQKGLRLYGVVMLMGLTMACGPETPRSETNDQASPPVQSTGSPQAADLSTPEGPLQVLIEAARDKNYELFRSAFSDSIPPDMISQRRFAGFAKRVKDGVIEVIPGVERINETEAILKFKNKRRNRERGFRVRKIGDRWLIVGRVG